MWIGKSRSIVGRDEHVAYHHIMAAGATQPTNGPRIDDLARRGRDNHEPGFGRSLCERRGFPSSWTMHKRTIQAPSSHPLTSDHRPLTRYPPSTTCACPEKRVLFAVTISGSAWMARAVSDGSWAIVQCVLPFQTHHAIEASARAKTVASCRQRGHS
jgi:hypothetical protein